MSLILVTNDDGIQSEGLHILAKELGKVGEVFLAAPDRERSAVGHSMTLYHPLRVNWINDHTIEIDGTPTDCVMLGVRRLLKAKPNLVVSGINKGPNLGDDVTYSGTVSAAIEGTILGIPSFAISLVAYEDLKFEVAAEFARKLAKLILKHGLPKDTLLNVNVPNVAREEIKGVRITRQGKRIYRDEIIENFDPRGMPYYWIGGRRRPDWKREKDTDFSAIEENMISITPLHLDMTNYQAITKLKEWESLFGL